MKLFGIVELTPKEESLLRVIALAVVAMVALITALLTSFMITEPNTKEHNWWVALMSIAWVAFAGTAVATAIAGSTYHKLAKNTTV